MWAQLIQMCVKPGADTSEMIRQIKDAEQPGSGLIRSIVLRDQRDPTRIHTLVMFESEEHARARENDPRRNEGLQAARTIMGEILDGPPEFVDLLVVDQWTGGTE